MQIPTQTQSVNWQMLSVEVFFHFISRDDDLNVLKSCRVFCCWHHNICHAIDVYCEVKYWFIRLKLMWNESRRGIKYFFFFFLAACIINQQYSQFSSNVIHTYCLMVRWNRRLCQTNKVSKYSVKTRWSQQVFWQWVLEYL